MNSISLIFPHQLFEVNPCLIKGSKVVLVEEYLFFRQYKFHKQKLVLHRASMKAYEQNLRLKGFDVEYIDSTNDYCDVRKLIRELAKAGVEKIAYCNTIDNWLEKRIRESAQKNGVQLLQIDTPNFICTESYINEYFNQKKRYFLTTFYTDQRLRLNVLIDNKKPVGGQWTFDTENRKKMPETTLVPQLPSQEKNNFVVEAIEYINQHFQHNPGCTQNFIYPISHHSSKAWLKVFLEQRFAHYGIYQDAIIKGQNFLFHSILTPMLNIGLLQPAAVIDEAIEAAEKHHIPINSLEGFVRQILGWREYIRAIYIREGNKQRTTNYWNHQRKIPVSFYNATTGIEPIDDCIKRLNETGYNHHIERLMLLGNFMCLCEFHPDEIYQWFMEMYIDAYDWVMVPNVYGMSQFADGGLMSTKPYISSSNYILKMSNYKKGNWCEIFDALYWNFIYKNRSFFEQNPRMSVMTKQLDKSGDKLTRQLQVAEQYLDSLG